MRSMAACLFFLASSAACGQAGETGRAPGPATTSQGADRVVAVGFVAGAPQLVAVSPAQLIVWDTDRARVVRRQTLDGMSLRLGGLLTPGSRHLVFTGARSSAEGPFETRLLDVVTGTTVSLAPPGNSIGRFAITEDGTTLLRATGSYEGGAVQIQTWRLPSGKPLSTSTIEDALGSGGLVALSPAGDRFALGVNRRTRENWNPPGPKGRIHLCETSTGRVLATLDTPDIPSALMFSADGAQLYWGTNSDAEVHVADASSGTPIASFGDPSEPPVVYGGRGGVPGSVQLLAVSPTWTHMITARRSDPTVKIWSPAGRALIQRVAMNGRASSIGVSLDGTQFAVGTDQGQTSIWDIRTPSSPTHTFSIR